MHTFLHYLNLKQFLATAATLALVAPAVNAQWFGKYGSLFEAKQACSKWEQAGPDRLKVSALSKGYRDCYHEKATKQFLRRWDWIHEEKNGKLVSMSKVLKRFRYYMPR